MVKVVAEAVDKVHKVKSASERMNTMVSAPQLHALGHSIGSQMSLLNGFMNGNRIGGNESKENAKQNGITSGFKGLNTAVAPQHGLLGDLASRIQRYAASPPSRVEVPEHDEEEDDEKRTESEKKSDKVELSNFAEKAIEEAVRDATLSNGATQQVFVSEDGRYEASIDLKINADGSFDLDIEVGLAEARAAAVQTTEPMEGEYEVSGKRGWMEMASAQYLQETTVEYERLLATRDWEASVFYSSTERVAAQVEQAHGSEMGGRVLSVGGQLSNEYRMNISVSGENLDSFLAQVEDLNANEDSAELGGFLDAVANVLTTSPDNIGDLLNATQALIGNVKEQVSSALDTFFGDIEETFGAELEEMGFGPEFLTEMKEKSQQGLNHFLDTTNNIFGNLLGASQTPEIEDVEADTKKQILEESLEMQKQAIEEQERKAEEKAKTEESGRGFIA